MSTDIKISWRREKNLIPQSEMDIVFDYWSRESNSKKFAFTQPALAKKHNITQAKLREIIKSTGWGKIDFQCMNCGENYIFPARKYLEEFEKSVENGRQLCDECLEEEKKKSLERRKKHVQDVWNGWNRQGGPQEVDEISLRHAIFLLAMNRSMAHENMSYFEPASKAQIPLAPESLIFPVISELWDAGLIGIHPGTALENFVWEDEIAHSVYTTQAHTVLPMTRVSKSFAPVMARLEERIKERYFQEDWDETLNLLKHELWKAEILAYLDLQLVKHGMSAFNPGKKTHFVIDKMLKSYSLGQCWNIVNSSVVKAAAAVTRGIPRKQATNSVITRMEGFSDRALAEGWDITAYRRDFNLPVTALSLVLWETVLQEPLQKAVEQTVLGDDDPFAALDC